MSTSKGVPRSRWLRNSNRQSITKVKVVGMNLQGKPVKPSMFNFFVKELQTTVFIIQFSIGSYSWQIQRTFDELREFHEFVLKDAAIRNGREYFIVRNNSSFLYLSFSFSFLFVVC
jgi:hypothetical protein